MDIFLLRGVFHEVVSSVRIPLLKHYGIPRSIKCQAPCNIASCEHFIPVVRDACISFLSLLSGFNIPFPFFLAT